MRRDFVYWVFALAIGVALAAAFIPALAYTPKELLGDRDVPINCDNKTRVCTIAQDDLEWMVGRDRLMHGILEQTAQQLKNCGVKGV